MEYGVLLNLDPPVILGIVNEKLRVECDSLASVAQAYGVRQRQLQLKLAAMGYRYDPLSNQFKGLWEDENPHSTH